MAEYYDIRVQGHLDPSWSSWFADLAITNAVGGEAMLSGMIVDQTALHGVLARIRDLGLPLLSVNRMSACGSHEADLAHTLAVVDNGG